MACLPLSEQELDDMKKELLEFVRRVSTPNGENRPEEIAILPAIVKLVLGQRF